MVDLSDLGCAQDRVDLFSLFIGLISSERVVEGCDVRRLERRSLGL